MKKIFLVACLVTISNLSLFGQTVEQPPRWHHKGTLAVAVPAPEAPQGLTTIYSSLGTDPTNLYNYIDTWLVSGPNSLVGISDFIAMPFTPKANSHISEVRAAILFYGNGADQVNLSIYKDSKGHPGGLLAGPVTVGNLPKSFTCCQLAVANFASVPVTGGKQYWVVANTPKTGQGSNFLGEWAGAVSPVLMLAGDAEQTGWVAFNGNGLPAGDILGTVP
ncbi:MAG: hypothetical protein WA172_04610 [Terriglobales bacterium]